MSVKIEYFLICLPVLSSCGQKTTPENPTPEPSAEFSLTVHATNGFISTNSPLSNPKFYLTIAGGEANYTISYTLDGEEGCLSNVFPNEEQVINVARSSEVKEHVLTRGDNNWKTFTASSVTIPERSVYTHANCHPFRFSDIQKRHIQGVSIQLMSLK